MKLLVEVVVIVCIYQVSGGSSTVADCNVINNYYGSEYQQVDHSTPAVPRAVGPPGKAGAPGNPGAPGKVGEKGEPGQALNQTTKISELEVENLSQNTRILELEKQNVNQTMQISKLEVRISQLEQQNSALQLKNSANDQQLQSIQQQLEILAAPTSCAFVNASSSGEYLINPARQLGTQFSVHCDFSAGTGNAAVTKIGHNNEGEREADTECDGNRCWRRDITYSATDHQIRSLIDISSTCKQYFKWRCYGSLMRSQAWINRRGTQKTNWPGSLRDGYCACGEAGTCEAGVSKCNCNNNDATWRADEGEWTTKDELPVKALLFGDLGTGSGYDERGFYTLGKLECSGRA